MLPARRFLAALTIMMVFLASVPGPAPAEEVQLKADHPERYTVQKGDTLWEIATKFLKSPWNWPKIWRANEQIKNPHLIYPGDVIVLRWVDGKPELTLLRNDKAPGPAPAEPVVPGETPPPPVATETRAPVTPPPPGLASVKLAPQVHTESIDSAIPTIPPDAIAPMLTQTLIVGKRELDRAGYVTVGLDNRIALGNGSEFYARGVTETDQEYFQVFRPGRALRHPVSNELLAYEAIYLGDARMLETGDPAKLLVLSAKQEISPADRLLAQTPKMALPYYFPHAPGGDVKGYIVSALNAVDEVGQFGIVTLSLGERDGMEEGTVLRVMYRAGKHKDPVTNRTYKLPDEESGLVMVFRTFEKLSYALVMSSTKPVHIGDAIVTP
jgi:LysM repeat protein